MKWIRITLLILVATSLHAQKFYGGAGGGYNFSLAQNVIINWQTADIDTTVTGSFGKGWSVAIFGGYAFTSHICAELRAEGCRGAMYSYTYLNNSRPVMPFDGYNEMHVNSFQLRPAIRLQTGGERWNFYLRQELVLGFNKEMHYNKLRQQWEIMLEKTGGISVGYGCGAGVSRTVGKRLKIYAECRSTIMSWAPKRGEYTFFTERGVDQLPGMTTSQKEIVYLDAVYANRPYNPSQPAWDKRKFLPMSAIGFTVGIQFGN